MSVIWDSIMPMGCYCKDSTMHISVGYRMGTSTTLYVRHEGGLLASFSLKMLSPESLGSTLHFMSSPCWCFMRHLFLNTIIHVIHLTEYSIFTGIFLGTNNIQVISLTEHSNFTGIFLGTNNIHVISLTKCSNFTGIFLGTNNIHVISLTEHSNFTGTFIVANYIDVISWTEYSNFTRILHGINNLHVINLTEYS